VQLMIVRTFALLPAAKAACAAPVTRDRRDGAARIASPEVADHAESGLPGCEFIPVRIWAPKGRRARVLAKITASSS